jgi:cytoskeletal protein RodZ
VAVFNNSNSELPESQIEYRDTGGARRWVALLIYLVLALVVATLVVFAGRWVYHRVSNNSGPTPTTIAPQKTSQPTKTSPSPSNKSATPNSANSGTPSPTPPSGSSSGNPGSSSSGTNKTPSNTAKPAPQPSSLPNNGPGQAIALFVATTFVAATLHFMAALRRAAKST